MTLLCVDLFLTRRCNLNCSYCYVKDKITKDENEVKRNVNTCQWLVDEFRKNAPTNLPQHAKLIEISLFGGEPTLAWDSIEALVEWQKTIKDIKIEFILITNMILMTEAKLDYCLKNKIIVRPSIDGCPEAMAISRPNQIDTIYDNARLVAKKGNFRWCRAVVIPETVDYMFDSIKFLIKDIGLKGVIQVLATGIEWTQKDLDKAKEQITTITDWWIDEVRKGNVYFLHHLRDTLDYIWKTGAMTRPCMSGLGCGAIDTNGDIYPCHKFCNSNTPIEYKMGNIYQGGIANHDLTNKLIKFNWKEYKKQHCKDCVAIDVCRSVCLYESIMHNKEIYAPTHAYCEMMKHYYLETYRAHNILDKEQNDAYYKMFKVGYSPKRAVIGDRQ